MDFRDFLMQKGIEGAGELPVELTLSVFDALFNRGASTSGIRDIPEGQHELLFEDCIMSVNATLEGYKVEPV